MKKQEIETRKCRICHIDIIQGQSASGWVHRARTHGRWFGPRSEILRAQREERLIEKRVSREMDEDHWADER